MDSTNLTARVLSVRSGQYGAPDAKDAWIFGVELDRDFDGHTKWIVETGDAAIAAQFRSAYETKSAIDISRDLLVDPEINAVD
jgi:hypothetical protein